MSIEILSLVAQTITGIGMIAVAAVAYFHSRRSQRLQAVNLYISYWRELNRLFLENSHAREARAQLMNRKATEIDDVAALVSIYINQALLAYYTWRFGVLPTHELMDEFKAIWAILHNRAGIATKFLATESYPKKFVKMFSNSGGLPTPEV